MVFVAGLVATTAGAATMAIGFDASRARLVSVGIGGLVASAGAAAAVIWQRLAHRHAARALYQAGHDAKHDALTGLINRAGLYRQLQAALDDARCGSTVVGVLFLDLNGFKAINDSLGHDAGDELLRVVAERLRATIRGSDFVARLGGDEFVVVCRGLLVADSVLSIGQQILRRFDEPVSLNGKIQEVATSIGAAIAKPGQLHHVDDLLRDADAAMYRAKREGLGLSLFDQAHRAELEAYASTERDLVRAVERNQLAVYYQPVVNVARGELLGFEALARWKHPERGLIEPREFLGMAERAGLLSEIGLVVLREACAQVALWGREGGRGKGGDAGSELVVSINLAEQQLLDRELPHVVEDVLEWSGLRPRQLMIEVADQTLAKHAESLDGLRWLRRFGIPIAIDGYGTGQWSFGSVRSFDMITSVKIDKSFIRSLVDDQASRAVVSAMVSIAETFGVMVIADGVEHVEQVELLRSMGVDVMQGYLFNEPKFADLVDPHARFSEWSTKVDLEPGLRPVSPPGAGRRSR